MARPMTRSNKMAIIGMKMEKDNRDDDVSNYNNVDGQARIRESSR